MPLHDFHDRYPALVGRLLQAIQGRRLGHGYLIIGDQYETLRRFAYAWIQTCLCPQRTAAGDACGTCRICLQVAAETVPNLQLVKPMSKSRMIRIDQVRDMERQLFLKSGGKLKIGLILEADCLNVESQNAFLKTLEEPAPDSMLLMVTVKASALLPTIRSRVQQISLLDNHLDYDMPDFRQLVAALHPLRRGAGALVAGNAAELLLGMLGQRQLEAEEEAKLALKSAKAEAADLEPSARKKLEEEAKAVASSAYKSRRELFLSALQTWFSQEYMRTNGIVVANLSNPEFYPDQLAPPTPSSVDALRSLRLVESLLRQLTFNVDEALAIHDFCQQVCTRNQAG